MSRVDFYHLQKQTLEEMLPSLLSKAYGTGKKTIIKIGNEERVEFINAFLWTYSETSFLPHGSKKDGFGTEQPIWLTSNNDNPNNAEFLFLVDGAMVSDDEIQKFERVFNIFDGNSEDALGQARSLWKELKSNKHEIYYWQQENDTWKQKA